jgi:two-component system LytT family response regulator
MSRKSISCIIVDDEPVAREILEDHLSKIPQVKIIASCGSAMDAFKVINSESVDLVFLDINMPEISGLSFAKSVTRDIRVIFTTAYREYAVDGFDLRAVDYLLKPISFERLMQGIEKYLEESRPPMADRIADLHQDKEEFLFVRADRKMVKVEFRCILYIESYGDYLKIHLEEGQKLVTRDTLSNIEARLPHEKFFRSHRSFLVSLQKVDSYTNDTIGIGKHEVPISRGYRDSVMEKLS